MRGCVITVNKAKSSLLYFFKFVGVIVATKCQINGQ